MALIQSIDYIDDLITLSFSCNLKLTDNLKDSKSFNILMKMMMIP
jgi:hypothetical protein